MSEPHHSANDRRVSIARLAQPTYEDANTSRESAVATAIAEVAGQLDWTTAERGPFGGVIPDGARVLVKPNWVLHANQGPWGMEPLVTHPSVIKATVAAALAARPGEVLVGDAPLQGCDFAALQNACGLPEWASDLQRRDARFGGVRDFRRTKLVERDGAVERERDQRAMDNFVLFDLAGESLLEPISHGDGAFRVTMYDPAYMQRTHAPGRHQYLVAREVIDADVIINLPKLKTHKKAGVTCALKNLIGINGNKEYLPHHRVGGSASGGDCYPGRSVIKRTLEHVLDLRNSEESKLPTGPLDFMSRALYFAARMRGDRLGIEGAWSGNDTIWRTCLDLNRILLYGRADGTLAATPQRQVLNIVDAVVAGHGDGPLMPQPLPLGLILGGASSAAVDWVGARLLGYDPRRIPIAREAFARFHWPLTTFAARQVEIAGAMGAGLADELLRGFVPSPDIDYPFGWQDAVDAAETVTV